jgi:hypothetical protein
MTTRHDPVRDERRVPGDSLTADAAASASEHVDRCIEAYAEHCRQRIPAFTQAQVSVAHAWTIQKRTFWRDLMIAPLNSLWSVPYWTIRKVCVGLEALGVSGASVVLGSLKAGVTSGYQKATDATLARDLLEWDLDGAAGLPVSLLHDLERHPGLSHLRFHPHALPLEPVRKVIDGFSSARALVADLAGAGFTLAVSWIAFRSTSMGLFDVANRVARQDAKSRAASHFVLGRPAGKVFFSVFRPEASRVEIAIILVVLALVIASGSMLCVLASEPVLAALGLQQRRLAGLVDKVERELVVLFNKQVKSALRRGGRGEAAGSAGVADAH